MGIKGLTKLLMRVCPDVFVETHMKNYAYTKIAVDSAIYICKLKMAAKEDFPHAMLSFVITLRANKIHPIFVFDGTPPEEKKEERRRRADAIAKQFKRVERLEKALQTYKTIGKLSDELKSIKCSNRRLLVDTFDIKCMEEYVLKARSNLFNVSSSDFDVLKTILDLTNTPRIQAKGEAEALCVQMVKNGDVKAALTTDSDALTYGCPLLFNKINYKENTFTAVCIDDILKRLELSYEQFVDLCIMCGTDYNKNIFRIGPNRALDLIKRYGSIDEIGKTMDVSVLNHKRVKEIFTSYKEHTEQLAFASVPSYAKLNEWMINNNVRMSVVEIRRQLENNPEFIQ